MSRRASNPTGYPGRRAATPLPGVLPPLSRQEEAQLLAAYRQHGDRDAFERLVRANLRFVRAIAGRHLGCGLSLQELVSIGCLGLVRAINGHDAASGTRLVAYAVWWIRNEIHAALATEVTNVRVPANAIADRQQVGLRRDQLEQERGASVSLAEAIEIATAEGLLGSKSPDPAVLAAGRDRSLDAPRYRDQPDGPTHLEALPAPSDDSEDDLVCAEVRDSVREWVALLEPRSRRIVELRFGIGRPAANLAQIGAELGISRQRVRQLLSRALDQMRADLLRQRSGPASRLVEMLELDTPSTAEAA